MMQDALQWLANGKDPGVIAGLAGGANTSVNPRWFTPFVDWRETAIKCNAFYDRLHTMSKIEDDIARQSAFINLEDEMLDIDREHHPVTVTLRMIAGARSRGRVAAEFLTNLMAPAMIQVDAAHVRSKMFGMALVGFEIEKFRLANGKLPNSLAELPVGIVGPYLKDRFLGGQIIFSKSNNGYFLYSPGANLNDELLDTNGSLIPHDEDEYIDDIVIKVEFSPAN